MDELSWSAQLISQTGSYLGKLPGALITLMATWVLVRLVKKVIISATKLARVDATAQSLLLSIVGFVGWIIGLAAALNVLGLTQISLALGGSVALVAMALATGLNTVTQDTLAGIFLLADDDFSIGVRVKAANIEGEIVDLSIRKTKIKDKDGLVHAIPNRNVDAATYTILPPASSEEEAKGA